MFKLELSVSLSVVQSKNAGKFITDFSVSEDITVDTATLTDLFTNRLYSTNQWKSGKCSNSNFVRMTGITIDIDNNMPMDNAKVLFAPFKYIMHTSTSHKANLPEKGGVQDRYRIILPLAPSQYNLITTEDMAKGVYAKVIEKYPFVDIACSDPARKYYPFANKQYPAMFELYINDTGEYYTIDINDVAEQKTAPKGDGVDIDDIYRLTLDDMFLMKDKKTWKKLRDFRKPVVHPFTIPVFCNACDDIHSQGHSAFVGFDYNDTPHVRCTHCQKTYQLNLLESFPGLFYIGSTLYKVIEQGEIAIDKCPLAFLNNLNPDIRKRLENVLSNKRLFANDVFRINKRVDGYAEKPYWVLDDSTAELNIYFPPTPVQIKDNDFIEKYLFETFGDHLNHMKLWMAIHCYENYQQLPVLVFNGMRGSGKSTFGEMLQNIYPQLSDEWKGDMENFTEYQEKKLLLVDEAEGDRRERYIAIKALTGADTVKINKKYMSKYRVKNNLNVIMTTNNDSPLYLVPAECPQSEFENQFFMFTFPDITRNINSNIKNELRARIGWYVKTVCRGIYEAWKDSTDRYLSRYGMPCPITPFLLQQYEDSRSQPDYETDEIYDACLKGYEVRDKQNNLMEKLGPYDLVNTAELKALIDAMRLKTNNIKTIREKMQSHGYLGRGPRLKKDNRDAWQVIPRDQLKKRNPNVNAASTGSTRHIQDSTDEGS